MTDNTAQLREQRDRAWRAIIKMAPAAGPSWTPRWIVDLMDDNGTLPDNPWDEPEC